MAKQLPLVFQGARKDDMRTQFGALCYRVRQGKVQILLITSRRSKRWIIPKGWPMDGKTPAQSAAQEAWEEAGVTGKCGLSPLGVYAYGKARGPDGDVSCIVMVYPLAVSALAKKYPEEGQRRRRWVSRKKAAKAVAEPELAQLIMHFDPRGAGKRA